MGSCSVSVTPQNFLIFTGHKTSFGLGILGLPYFKVERNSSQAEIGSLIIESLNSSRSNFDISERSPKDILKLAGYRSWRAFERDAIAVEIYEDKKEVVLIPTDPAPTGGFLHDPDNSVSCAHDAEEIGIALFQMLEDKKKQYGLGKDW